MLVVCDFYSIDKLYSQDTNFILPVKERVLLSGSFGELRSTHIHSGIDIKTGQKIGMPVYAVNDGIISRISISGTGYGNCIYIDYPDGHTSVYGHLSKFIPKIDSILNHLHYKNHSFKLDVDFLKYNIKVKQGEILAWSGDSGSSGGPHLHFEIRDTKTSYALNPLLFYKIYDNFAPNVLGVYLYNIDADGYPKLYKEILPTKLYNNKYLICDTIPEGKYGLAFYLEDKMPGSHNKLGVRNLIVNRVDTTEIDNMLFSMNMDTISFYQTKYINAIKDFDAYKDGKTVYRCFGHYQNDVIGVKNNNSGIFTILDSTKLEYRVKTIDYSGNVSTISLKFYGSHKENNVLVDSAASLIRMDKSYNLESNGFAFRIKSGSLFHNVRKKIHIDSVGTSSLSLNTNIVSKKISDIPYQTILYVVSSNEVPLLKPAKININGDFKQKDIICEVDSKGRLYPLISKLIPGGISASTYYLSKYIVVTDSIPPRIVYQGYNSKNSAFVFKIEDGISGIKSFKGTVNGKWILLFYDPKTLSLYCRDNEPLLMNKKNVSLHLKVWDKVGNMSMSSVVLRKTEKK